MIRNVSFNFILIFIFFWCLLLLYCMGEIRTNFHLLKSLFIDRTSTLNQSWNWCVVWNVTLFIWLSSVLSNWVMWFVIIILSSNFIINFQFLKHLRICGAIYSSRPMYCNSEFCWYILVRAVSINENLFTWGTVFFSYVWIIAAQTVWVETWAECTLWKEVNCLHRLSELVIFHK